MRIDADGRISVVEPDCLRKALEEIVASEYCADCEQVAFGIASKALKAA